MKLIGTKLSDLKKHKALIPIYACLGMGVLVSSFYIVRLALRNPDVAWQTKEGKISNDAYDGKQYKFLSPSLDYSKVTSPAPKY